MALKRYGVNITRTITLEHTIYVKAKNEADARARVQAAYDAGTGGSPDVRYSGAQGILKDPEGSDISDEIEVDDAFQEDED